jgi:uncharacterized FlgJ-related protein
LLDQNCKKPHLKNRVDEATESAVIAIATEFSAYGQVRTSIELRNRYGERYHSHHRRNDSVPVA